MVDVYKEANEDLKKSILAQEQQADLVASPLSGHQQFNTLAEAEGDDILDTAYNALAVSPPATWVHAAYRAYLPDDPTFRIQDNTDLYEDLPTEYWSEFTGGLGVKSRDEGYALKEQIQGALHDKAVLGSSGVSGMAATMLSSIIDVDLPITMITGGSSKVASTLAKAGMTGRAAKMLSTAAGGAEAGIVTSVGSAIIDPTGTWADVPYAGLTGLAFGGALGTLGKTQKQIDLINDQAAKLRQAFHEGNLQGKAGEQDHTAPTYSTGAYSDVLGKADDLEGYTSQTVLRADETQPKDFGPDTVGAAAVHVTQDPNSIVQSTKAEDITAASQKFLDDNDVETQWASGKDTPMGHLARNMNLAVDATPVVTDMARLMNSKSPTAKVIGYLFGEDASGRVRNNTSAAMLTDLYTPEILAPVMLSIEDSFLKYAGKTRKKGILGDIQAVFDSPAKRLEFYKAVRMELEARLHDGVEFSPGVHPAVKELADQIDIASAKALEIGKGMDGEIPLRGTETLKPTKGWFRNEWTGAALQRIMKTGVKEDVIVQALESSYRQMHPTWEDAWYLKMAKAIVRTAQTQLSGIDTNLMRMLQENGVLYMQKFFRDMGFDDLTINKMIGGLRDVSPDTEKAGPLRHRKTIDLRTPIQGTPFHLADLTNMDIANVWSRYSRKMGGFSAMARHGVQYGDRRILMDAMLSEDPSLTPEFVEGFFSYFSGEPVAGGVNPWVQRPIRATNLALLGGIALSQAAETSVGIASMGVKSYMSSLMQVARAHWNGNLTSTLKQLEPWMKIIHGEEHLMRPDLAIAEMSTSSGMYAEQGVYIDKMLAKGARLQSIISGFNTVRRLQTNTIIHSMTGKLDTVFRKMAKAELKSKDNLDFEAKAAKIMNPDRLYDIGIDKVLRDRLMKYWTNGTVSKLPNGEVNLNFDKWDAHDVRELAAVLNRTAGIYVQRGFIGEGTVWFNKTEGAVLTNLKKFALLATQKQAVRNMRIADSESVGALTWSLGVASTVAMVRNALNGRDNTDPVEISKQAFMLSNLTGWVPMWSDPITGMLGMDDLKFSQYYRQGLGGDVVGTPPVFSTIGQIAHVPEAAASIVTGNKTKDDINVMKSTPVVGRLLGMGLVWKALLDDVDEDKAEDKLEMNQREIDHLESKKTSIFYEPSKEDDTRLRSLNKSKAKATGKEQPKTAIKTVQDM